MSRLEEILAHTRAVVALRKAQDDAHALEHMAAGMHPRGFVRALRAKAASGVAVIAELKMASPSKGLIRADFDAASLAQELSVAGAAALSVLTEEKWFRGSLGNLLAASDPALQAPPCLRKDFMVDAFQMLEARAHGADAVLLLANALDDHELRLLAREARLRELDVLCEVHTAAELERTLALVADGTLTADHAAIGINSRDLRSFDVSLNATLQLAERFFADAGIAATPFEERILLVAESGITRADDIRNLRAAGFGAFLVGETLMRAERPGELLASWLAALQAGESKPCG